MKLISSFASHCDWQKTSSHSIALAFVPVGHVMG